MFVHVYVSRFVLALACVHTCICAHAQVHACMCVFVKKITERVKDTCITFCKNTSGTPSIKFRIYLRFPTE